MLVLAMPVVAMKSVLFGTGQNISAESAKRKRVEYNTSEASALLASNKYPLHI